MRREKYMRMVCKEFNLGKNEKWVITKLRMMLVRLNAGMELLQIRNSENLKMKRKASVAQETVSDLTLSKLQRVRSMKNTSEADQTAFTKEYLISSV
jgi:hypothetical protein